MKPVTVPTEVLMVRVLACARLDTAERKRRVADNMMAATREG